MFNIVPSLGFMQSGFSRNAILSVIEKGVAPQVRRNAPLLQAGAAFLDAR